MARDQELDVDEWSHAAAIHNERKEKYQRTSSHADIFTRRAPATAWLVSLTLSSERFATLARSSANLCEKPHCSRMNSARAPIAVRKATPTILMPRYRMMSVSSGAC